MDKKTIFGTLTRLALASIASTLVKDGYLQSSGSEAFIGAGMLIATAVWGVWNGYLKDIAKAELEILRAKVQFAAAKARTNPSTALPSLSSLDAHVTATAPLPPVPAPPMASLILLALGLSALLLASGSPAAAQNGPPRPTPRLTGNPVQDIKNAVNPNASEEPKLTGDPIADLHAVIQKGGQKLILHLKQTYALASAPGPDGAVIDPVSAPCAKALVPIVDLVVNGPKMGVITAPDPMAFSADEVTMNADTSAIEGLPVKIEKLRILRISLSSPALTIACGPLVQDEVKQAKSLAGGLASLMTGAGLLGIGL